MPVPASIDDLSTTAGSNSPGGSEGPQEGDNYLRAHASFIALLRDKLDGTSDTGTVKNATFSGTMAGAATWAGLQTFADGIEATDGDFSGDVTVDGDIEAANVTSGVWTPTPTKGLNIATMTVSEGIWSRVGDVIGFSVSGTIDATSGAPSVTEFSLTLPVASNFSNGNQAGGTFVVDNGGSVVYEAGMIFSDATNDRLGFSYKTAITSNQTWRASGFYRVL